MEYDLISALVLISVSLLQADSLFVTMFGYIHILSMKWITWNLLHIFMMELLNPLFIWISVLHGVSGKRKIKWNYLMYDIFDLNNTMDPGDNNSGPGNGDIRNGTKEKEMQNVQYKDVVDLIDDTDLY